MCAPAAAGAVRAGNGRAGPCGETLSALLRHPPLWEGQLAERPRPQGLPPPPSLSGPLLGGATKGTVNQNVDPSPCLDIAPICPPSTATCAAANTPFQDH